MGFGQVENRMVLHLEFGWVFLAIDARVYNFIGT